MRRWPSRAPGRVALSHAPGDARLIRFAWREKSCTWVVMLVARDCHPGEAGILYGLFHFARFGLADWYAIRPGWIPGRARNDSRACHCGHRPAIHYEASEAAGFGSGYPCIPLQWIPHNAGGVSGMTGSGSSYGPEKESSPRGETRRIGIWYRSAVSRAPPGRERLSRGCLRIMGASRDAGAATRVTHQGRRTSLFIPG